MKKLLIGLGAVLALGMVAFTAPQAQAGFIPADIVWLVDTSGSMGDDIAQVKARIVDFNTAMVNAGIDAQYGLVRFGEPPQPTLIQDITTFDIFNQAGSPFQNLSANGGGTESGSLATLAGLTATFRPGTVKNFILVTDEDDDSSLANFQAADAGLTAADALFNAIVDPGYGNTDSRYVPLALNHGGGVFDILQFRANPDQFFDNFIQTKVQEIIEKAPEAGSTIGLLLLAVGGLLGLRRR